MAKQEAVVAALGRCHALLAAGRTVTFTQHERGPLDAEAVVKSGRNLIAILRCGDTQQLSQSLSQGDSEGGDFKCSFDPVLMWIELNKH